MRVSSLRPFQNRIPAWVWLLLFSLALAWGLSRLTEPEPVGTDRPFYEQMGAHPLSPTCVDQWLCPRVLAPYLAASLPLPNETAWRVQGILARAGAGLFMGLVALRLTGKREGGFAAVVLTQGSFALAYTVYDPWSADPLVFLLSALFAFAWFFEMPLVALAAGVVGGFTKQSPMVVAGCLALAALVPPCARRWPLWLVQAGIAVAVQLSVTAFVQHLSGLDQQARVSTLQFAASGGWLGIQIGQIGQQITLSEWLLNAVASFGAGWLYAGLGLRGAPRRVTALAMGSVLPFLVLCELQGDLGRSLGNAFFVVVPLEVLFLMRLPTALRWMAIVSNVGFVIRVAQTPPQLPSSVFMLLPALLAVLAVAWWLMSGRVAGWSSPVAAPVES